MILVMAFNVMNAQQSSIDSLTNKLQRHQNEDSIKVEMLNAIAFSYINSNPGLMREYANMAQELAEKIGYAKGLARATANIASSYWASSEYEEALTLYLSALDIYKDMNDDLGIFQVYNNIGEVYKKMGNLGKALEFHDKSLETWANLGKDTHPALSHYNRGELYFMGEQNGKAIMEYETAEWMAIDDGSKKVLAYAKTGLGQVYLRLRNHEKAKSYLLDASSIWLEIDDKRGLAYSNLDLARLYYDISEWELAKQYIQDAMKFAEKGNVKDIKLQIFLEEAKLDSANGNMRGALQRYQQYVSLKDSLFNLEREKLVTNIQAKYELREQEQINDQLARAKAVSEEIVNYQKTIIGAFTIIVSLIALMTVAFYRQWRRKSKINAVLQMKNQEIESNAKELEVLNNNLERMVEERTSVIHKKNDQFKEYSFLNAHFVRGPLANIIGLTNLLGKTKLPPEQQDLLGHIQDSSEKLDKVLGEIKEKLEKGEHIN